MRATGLIDLEQSPGWVALEQELARVAQIPHRPAPHLGLRLEVIQVAAALGAGSLHRGNGTGTVGQRERGS